MERIIILFIGLFIIEAIALYFIEKYHLVGHKALIIIGILLYILIPIFVYLLLKNNVSSTNIYTVWNFYGLLFALWAFCDSFKTIQWIGVSLVIIGLCLIMFNINYSKSSVGDI